MSIEQKETLSKLSKREIEIAMLILEGEHNKTIAKKLDIKTTTVSTYKRLIFLKLGINSEIALYKILKETV